MRVAVDVNPLVVGSHRERGIGHSTAHLVHALLGEAAEADPAAEFLLCHAGGTGLLEAAYPWFARSLAPRHGSRPGSAGAVGPPGRGGRPRVLVRALEPGRCLLAEARRAGAEVVHVTDYFHPLYDPAELPRRPAAPLVVTVRDLIPLVHPEWNTQGRERLRRHLLPLLERAAAVVAISRWTARHLTRHLGLDAGRVRVIPHGVARWLFRPASPAARAAVRKKLGLGHPFVLCVSPLDGSPRKNLDTLLRAFAAFRSAAPGPWRLCLAGPGRPAEGLLRLVRRLRLEERVVFTGYVDEEDLPALYSAAACLAFPSRAEGFGLPLLEAMACGTPVLASSAAAAPEVAGEAALLADPERVEDWVQGLWRLAADGALRTRLVLLGLRRARLFSWRRAARAYLDLFRAVASG